MVLKPTYMIGGDAQLAAAPCRGVTWATGCRSLHRGSGPDRTLDLAAIASAVTFLAADR
jgi:hypothetical protein